MVAFHPKLHLPSDGHLLTVLSVFNPWLMVSAGFLGSSCCLSHWCKVSVSAKDLETTNVQIWGFPWWLPEAVQFPLTSRLKCVLLSPLPVSLFSYWSPLSVLSTNWRVAFTGKGGQMQSSPSLSHLPSWATSNYTHKHTVTLTNTHSPTLTYSHYHTHTHSQSHTLILIHTYSHTHSPTLTHILTFSHTLTITHTYTHSHILTHTHSHTHSLIHTHPHSYSHTYTHSHTLTHTHILTHRPTLILTHSHTHTQSHTHSFTHTHTHIVTHTLTLTHSPPTHIHTLFSPWIAIVMVFRVSLIQVALTWPEPEFPSQYGTNRKFCIDVILLV